MKKILSIIVAVALIGTLTGCEAPKEQQATTSNGYILELVYQKESLCEYVDKETGVHYFVVITGFNALAITPRYDKNGDIYITQEE